MDKAKEPLAGKLKKMLDAGVPLPDAVKAALKPGTLTEFATKHSRSLTAISKALNGGNPPTDADLAAFVAEFGETADYWRVLIYEQNRPTVTV